MRIIASTGYMGKIKLFNDPVYGLLHIPSPIIFQLIEHPFFQRLRRIKQLGLTDMIYPGAQHTRFHHTLGAVHLMVQALDNLKLKGVSISQKEYDAALVAILLHDIGHGPFSHALENQLVEDTSHEKLSLAFMHWFAQQYGGCIPLAIEMFTGKYHRPFFCQLVSGQLDVDRLDYLRRDSFYTGVSEGIIGSDRIIKMMNVANDQLVVEEKGIYSIEKFLIARNLMYWQVYLHKTVLCAELMLLHIIKRAKWLANESTKPIAPEPLQGFLREKAPHDVTANALTKFAKLDDHDIIHAIKRWVEHEDKVLQNLSKMLLNRELLKVELHNQPISQERIQHIEKACMQQTQLSEAEVAFFVYAGAVSNTTYREQTSGINLLNKEGKLISFSEASRQYDLNVVTKEVQKHYICYPKFLSVT